MRAGLISRGFGMLHPRLIEAWVQYRFRPLIHYLEVCFTDALKSARPGYIHSMPRDLFTSSKPPSPFARDAHTKDDISSIPELMLCQIPFSTAIQAYSTNLPKSSRGHLGVGQSINISRAKSSNRCHCATARTSLICHSFGAVGYGGMEHSTQHVMPIR
jgi:hypothetical protein